MTEKPP